MQTIPIFYNILQKLVEIIILLFFINCQWELLHVLNISGVYEKFEILPLNI